jgi:hypothetical protein
VLLLVLLALGSVAGFGSAFFGWRHHDSGWGAAWQERRLDAVAEACVRAAERVNAGKSSPAPPPPEGNGSF